ncbi:MAG: CBS domain-containing protein, partial [Deltaproteobacteria bacterium]|nr:CBS domain-containing protein [Deltaproteobacteria bacterium]
RQGESDVTHFYLIQKGGVRTYRLDGLENITLKDFRGEGEHFGALPIIQNTMANLNVETLDDTFCFLFDRQDFLNLIETNQKVKRHYLSTMSEKMAKPVYSELRQQKITPRAEGALFLFNARAGEISKGTLFTASLDTSVQKISQLMSEKRIGSILLTDVRDEIVGIVTDKDIRGKVVARGLDYHTKASEIMAAPVQTISGHAICFDALLAMIKNRIHHLAIEEDGKISKMLTTHDIMVAQGSSPYFLFREIQAQRRISGLYELSRKIPMIVRPLIEEGAKACNVSRMISVLNGHLLERLLMLLQEELGKAPLPFSWLLIGREGRHEQVFKISQTNAVVYGDSPDERTDREAKEYFRTLSEQAVKHLIACGYPSDPGDSTAFNAKWRQPQSVWNGYFQDWCRFPDRDRNYDPSIFFDVRSGAGNVSLAEKLKEKIHTLTRGNEQFLRYLAQNFISLEPPLSFYGNSVVEKDGQYGEAFDLDGKGAVFFVDFARAMSLKYGICKTSTLERLQSLQEKQHIPSDLGSELVEAYELLMHIGLVHQLHLMEDGREPNNKVSPGDLSDLEKQSLKEVFEVIRRLQGFARYEFGIPKKG